MSTYSEESIKTLEKLESVRKRPTQFIVSTETSGQVHIAQEVIANSMDELLQMNSGHITVLLCKDAIRNTYQLVVKDNGRGVPIGSLLKVFTRLDTSGKYDTNSYKYSGGSFGKGAKVTAGLSSNFRAITKRTDGMASVGVSQGIPDEKITQSNIPQIETGTIVIFEPDPTIFTEIDRFSEFGYTELILLIQKQCFFHSYNVDFKIYPTGLPTTIWKDSIKSALHIIDTYIAEAKTFFSEALFDRLHWIKTYWNSSRPYVWTHTIHNSVPEPGNSLEYLINYYYARYENSNVFGMVNNVPIDDWKSNHISVVLETLKNLFAPLIKDAAMRAFYLDSYKLPISIAVDVKYEGAQFVGTTKHAFVSKPFRTIFSAALQSDVSSSKNYAQFLALFELLREDIEQKYEAQIGNISKTKDLNRLAGDLKFPTKFKDCSTTDRKKAELFIVEGDSAGGTTGRDAVHHAIYTIRGKPFNAVTNINSIRQSRIALQNDFIYHDIIKLMGINPSKPNMDDLNFGSLIITTDADSDGYHICEILVGNLYMFCPPLVESGVIHIVTPPLYGIDISKKVKNNTTDYIYFRNETMLTDWMCKNVYMEAIDISIKAPGIFNKYKQLTPLEYSDFVKLVLKIGDIFVNVAGELVLDPQTVEALSYVTQYLAPGYVDIERIKDIIGVDRVTYDPNGHILILSKEGDDVIIPLQNVCERLYTKIIPELNNIAWKKLEIYITTRHTGLFKNRRVTLMQLYQLLRSSDNMFNIDRYKGLGSMTPKDRVKTCMNPEYRVTHQVTSVGDVATIFNLLGSDSIHRKKLLTQ